ENLPLRVRARTRLTSACATSVKAMVTKCRPWSPVGRARIFSPRIPSPVLSFPMDQPAPPFASRKDRRFVCLRAHHARSAGCDLPVPPSSPLKPQMMKKRFVRATLLLLAPLLTPNAAHGTGYYGPNLYLDLGGKNVTGSPEFFWELETKRLARNFHPSEK